MMLTMLLSADLVGLIPDDRDAILRGRKSLCESISIPCSVFISRGDLEAIDTCFEAISSHNPDIQSMAVRRADGSLLRATDKHDEYWSQARSQASSGTYMEASIYHGSAFRGTVEVCYAPAKYASWIGQYVDPVFALCTFCVLGTMSVCGCYLKQVFTMPTLSRVASQRFGRHSTSLPWSERKNPVSTAREIAVASCELNTPWRSMVPDGQSRQRSLASLQAAVDRNKTLSARVSPIRNDSGHQREAIASEENVSRLEQKKDELASALQSLRLSNEKVRKQNAILERLATRDPLTNCHNRRSFFEQFDIQWNAARCHERPLSVVMIDVDHFKSVNDNHGHCVGDTVLQKVAETLQRVVRDTDIVGRYGGEEFTLLLPNTELPEACVIAERICKAIEDMQLPKLTVTVSLGVSSLSQNPVSPQDLLEQADKCLYFAKRNGRNQVACYDQLREEQYLSDREQSARTVETLSP